VGHIRDRIAASKRKGMWMGGMVPLGYEVVERRLVINPTEAALVREVYARYLELASIRLHKQELDRRGRAKRDVCSCVPDSFASIDEYAARANIRGPSKIARG